MIQRSNSISKIRLTAISWRDDSMIIDIPRHKGDQEGEHCYPRALYANVYQPEICPVLAVAIRVFSTSMIGENGLALFKGSAPEQTFSRWLHALIERNILTPENIGVNPKEIGSHSLRKGSATYAASFPGGPDGLSIFLRAG